MSQFLERLWARARQSLLVLGALAFAAGTVALIVVTAMLFKPPSGRDGRPDVVQEGRAPPAAPSFPASDYAQSRFPRTSTRPLIGVNYTHHGFRDCSFNGTAILRTYSQKGIAEKVHAQLRRMRQNGIATIRTIVWHASDARRQSWGPVSSAGGRLPDPYRTNLIRYLTEVKRFGFARLTLSFGPQQDQNPLRATYNPGHFSENWRFIRTVRALLKRYGPRDTRIDLLNEGAPSEAPSEWSPVPQQTADYLRELYRLYVRAYGNRDVSVSTIAWDPTYRLENLVSILQSSGERTPRWYDIHVGYNSSQAAAAFRETNRVLTANGLSPSLVVGEVAYDNRGIARSISRFRRAGPLQVEEVSPWYVRTQRGCQIAPPYSGGVYTKELRPIRE